MAVFDCMWLFVIPLVQNSNSFLEDLRRLNQLKESLYQYDMACNPPKKSKIHTKVRQLKR
ncbi:hypothetical protein DC487_13405 [Sphingobacterium corticibacter]|uniref:Uncharacterized protein n=1 Tax=Sphingobacterium corticibacter TaxID=2171749 RepID=A0A2T8HGF8_9SPHI|nr:hypothetical protein DC487_13405 [Sphingobacterium corticibacter]